VNRFDVSVYAIRRRAGRRRPFEVRWRAASRSRSKSFITRRLADSYRAELVRAARMGLLPDNPLDSGNPPALSPSGESAGASELARRPYDLRHAALSLWLNAGRDPAQIAARAGNSVAVLLTVYSRCTHGHEDLLNQQIGQVLEPSAMRPWIPARPADGPWTTPTPNGHTRNSNLGDSRLS
jgi:hypothetical protein